MSHRPAANRKNWRLYLDVTFAKALKRREAAMAVEYFLGGGNATTEHTFTTKRMSVSEPNLYRLSREIDSTLDRVNRLLAIPPTTIGKVSVDVNDLLTFQATLAVILIKLRKLL